MEVPNAPFPKSISLRTQPKQMDPSIDDYFKVALRGANENSRLRKPFQSHLGGTVADSAHINLDDVCLMADIGGFLIHALEILTRFATDAIYGEDVILYTQHRLEQLEEQGDFSDMGVVDYLDDKHAALKFIAIELENTVRNCRVSWNESSPRPNFERLLEDLSSHSPKPATVPPNVIGPFALNPHPDTTAMALPRQDSNSSTSRTEASTSSPQTSSSQLTSMEQLKQRGKCTHFCPLGHACTKGGVHQDGTLVNFERNSAFRAHEDIISTKSVSDAILLAARIKPVSQESIN